MISVPGQIRLTPAEEDNLRLNLAPALEDDESIAAVELLAVLPDADGLLVDNVATNAEPVEINQQIVPAGQAILCSVDDGVIPVGKTRERYEVRFKITTDATPPRVQETRDTFVLVES